MTKKFNQEVHQESIAWLIQQRLKSLGITKADFGNQVNPPVTQPTVSRWTQGVLPDRKYWASLAVLLERTYDEIMKRADLQIKNWPEQTQGTQNLNAAVRYANMSLRHVSVFNRGVTTWNEWRKKNPDTIPLLSGVSPQTENLVGYDLRGAILNHANLLRVNLTGADLSGANLIEATLTHSVLDNANLHRANLEGASLRKARGSHANFTRASLVKAHLEESYFAQACFHGANLEQAYLTKTNLLQADLGEAKLERARFRCADLRLANLNFADCKGTVLEECLIYGVMCLGLNFSQMHQKNLNVDPNGKIGNSNSIIHDLRQSWVLSIFPLLVDHEVTDDILRLIEILIEEDNQRTDVHKLEKLLSLPSLLATVGN
jgi:uncharacterized protein YjbI with pentapeptide repeats